MEGNDARQGRALPWSYVVQVGRFVGITSRCTPRLSFFLVPPLTVAGAFPGILWPLSATNGPGWISQVVGCFETLPIDPSDDGSSPGVVVSASLSLATAANQRRKKQIIGNWRPTGHPLFHHPSRSKPQSRPFVHHSSTC